MVSTNVPEAIPSLRAWRKDSVAGISVLRIRVIYSPGFYIVTGVDGRQPNERQRVFLARWGVG